MFQRFGYQDINDLISKNILQKEPTGKKHQLHAERIKTENIVNLPESTS